MKLAHVKDGHTRGPWRHSGDTRDRAPDRRPRRRCQAVQARSDDPRRDRGGSRAGGGRPRHGGSFVRVLTRRGGGSPGVNRRPGRHWTTRSPRCAGDTRAGRGDGTGRSEGRHGAYGARGPAGATGATGARGPAGATGATGASGTVIASTTTAGSPVLSAVDAPVGTSVTASVTCPQGDVALGGGAQVSAPGLSNKSVALRSSYPTTTNGWRAVGSVIAPLGAGAQMTVRPYVLCGATSQS